jgi:hypothetical protein
MSDQFATSNARMSVWSALSKLAIDRRMAEVRGETKPSGIVTNAFGFRQVQVDLH